MYLRLKSEMIKIRINQLDIAEFLGKPLPWVQNRMQGKAKFDVLDAIKIKEEFFPDIPIEQLFERTQEQSTA